MTERVMAVKAGDELYFKMHGGGEWFDQAKPPCEAKNNGHWYCLTHQVGFRNAFDKGDHLKRDTHRMVWWCHEHGAEQP